MKHTIFSNKATAIALAVVVSILWGTLFPTIKIGYKAFGIDSAEVASILLFVGVRFFFSGLLLVGRKAFEKEGLTFLASVKAIGPNRF